MFQSKIAEWSYYLGCVSAALAIVYRAFWLGGLGARLFGTPQVIPHNFLDLSILLFVPVSVPEKGSLVTGCGPDDFSTIIVRDTLPEPVEVGLSIDYVRRLPPSLTNFPF